MKIISVSVAGFWGRRSLQFALHKDVNLIIGKNGSGKTQLLNLIYSVITVNINIIKDMDFKSVGIEFDKDGGRDTLRVSKDSIEIERLARDREGKRTKIMTKIPIIRYQFGGKSFILQDRDYGIGLTFTESDRDQEVSPEFMYRQLQKIFKVVFLSVNRKQQDISTAYSRQERYANTSVVSSQEGLEQKISSLIERVGNNRVRLSNQVSIINKKGEKELLSALLFEDPEGIKIDRVRFNSKKARMALTKTLDDLNFLDDDVRGKIENMFNEIDHLLPKRDEIMHNLAKRVDEFNRLMNVFAFMGRLDKVN